MSVNAIAAMSKNRVIGCDNRLPWRLPEDMRFFKEKTTGHPVIMGRKTFESFKGPLPNRENIVLTRNRNFSMEGVRVFSDLAEALEAYKDKDVFVIGGAEIYALAMPFTQRIYLTVIEREFVGDTFFPEIPKDFKLIEARRSSQSEPEPLDFEFRTYSRV